MKRKRISEIIGLEFVNWKKNDLILIEAGTGTGKSYFIKNVLNEFAMEYGKKILLLTNRNILKQQVKTDIGKDTSITVINYQKIESKILHKVQLDDFDYIVCDECHYFFTDSAFSKRTDLFLPKLLKDSNVCKIFMTATPNLFKNYLKKEKYNIDFHYKMKTDYSYLNKIVAFDDYDFIDEIITDTPQDEQIIIFTQAKRALEISKKYNGTFICSEYNKDGLYSKHIKIKTKEKDEDGNFIYEYTENYNELQRIIENGTFNNRLLCTTTVLDNGINIKEFNNVKHIIIDVLDVDTFIQCLGRKRIGDGESLNLYFYSWENDNKRINGFKKRIGDSIDRAKIIFNEGEEVYINTKFKNDKFIDGRIIDDVWENGATHKQVNKCIYQKYIFDLDLYNTLLSKDNKLTFKDIIGYNIDRKDISVWKANEMNETLEEYLESNVGVKMFKEEQKIFAKRLEDFGLKARTLGINTVNGYIKDNDIPYIIEAKRGSERVDGKIKSFRYWIVGKIVF